MPEGPDGLKWMSLYDVYEKLGVVEQAKALSRCIKRDRVQPF